MSVNGVARRSILAAAHNPLSERLVGRYGMRMGASRFVAGETLDECIAVLRRLNRAGFKVNTTILGEAVRDVEDARRVTGEYETVLRRLAAERIDGNVSLKPSHIGLAAGPGVAEKNLHRLAGLARELGLFVRLDMEESSLVDATLDLYRALRRDGYDNVGTVLQAYLYRTQADLESLLPLRPNLRLVKGAYLEPAAVAYPRKKHVDQNYARLIGLSLESGGYTAIATHDEVTIEEVIRLIERERIGRDRFEFQMLYGVRPQLQAALVARGYRVLVATPFGREWYPYLMRRLAERPANVLFLLRNLVRA